MARRRVEAPRPALRVAELEQGRPSPVGVRRLGERSLQQAGRGIWGPPGERSLGRGAQALDHRLVPGGIGGQKVRDDAVRVGPLVLQHASGAAVRDRAPPQRQIGVDGLSQDGMREAQGPLGREDVGVDQRVGRQLGRSDLEPGERGGGTEIGVDLEHRDGTSQGERLRAHGREAAEHGVPDRARAERPHACRDMVVREPGVVAERPHELLEQERVSPRHLDGRAEEARLGVGVEPTLDQRADRGVGQRPGLDDDAAGSARSAFSSSRGAPGSAGRMPTTTSTGRSAIRRPR